MFYKRVATVLVVVMGIAGMVCCLAGAYGIWLVASRLERANDKVFDAVDRSLNVVQDRVPIVQQKVKESKVTTAEVTEALPKWAAKKAQDRIVSKLEIESKAEKLSDHLRTADLTLEASREAVGNVRQLLELSENLGAKVDASALDAVQEQLVSLQESLQQAERVVDGVIKYAESDPVEDQLTQVAKLLARILLTLSEVEQRLDNLTARLSEARTQARLGNSKTSRYIVLGSAACYGLLAWVGAGQAALSWWGWNVLRWRRSPAQR
jgi:hypothetical protein